MNCVYVIHVSVNKCMLILMSLLFLAHSGNIMTSVHDQQSMFMHFRLKSRNINKNVNVSLVLFVLRN